MTIDLNKPLNTHYQMVGISGATCSLVVPSFSVVFVVLSGDVVNPIFRITLMIFFHGLPMDSYDGLDFVTTGLN